MLRFIKNSKDLYVLESMIDNQICKSSLQIPETSISARPVKWILHNSMENQFIEDDEQHTQPDVQVVIFAQILY